MKRGAARRENRGASPVAAPATSRQRVLDSAIELFATRGFDAVTVRDITAHAGANLAAINYYFESKENLIRLVFKHAAVPINTMILSRLSEYEASRTGRSLELEPILRAQVEPVIRSLMDTSAVANLAQIYAQSLMWPSNVMTAAFDEGQNEDVFSRVTKAMMRAMPGRSLKDIGWCMYFASGATYTATRDMKKNFHFRRIMKNQCETGNCEVIIDQLIRFLLAAFQRKVTT